MLRIYKIYNSTVRFLKYEFYNKLLKDVILLKVTVNRTWTSLNSYIYLYFIDIIKINSEGLFRKMKKKNLRVKNLK